MRPAKAAMLRRLLPVLPGHIHYLVFTRLLSHNKRLEEYPATRMAFGEKFYFLVSFSNSAADNYFL